MDWVLPPPPPSSSQSNSFNNNVSPSILLIIIIIAIIFFISGLLHLLVRFLLRPPNRNNPHEIDDLTALQGQLQQLFHLHDCGVDQSFIDTLPVFNYKSIILGNHNYLKDPFDCAVCLCEFEADDKLRLLPKCSHAFHMECIDTWLLSHSTCPICRASLVLDLCNSNNCNFSPVIRVLESGNESFREGENSVSRVNSRLGSHFEGDLLQKSGEIQVKESENQKIIVGCEEKVVLVKLGKYRSVNATGGEGSSESESESNGEARRCFSMGSFAYVMDENSSLKVPICRTKQSRKKHCLNMPLVPGHRQALSECGLSASTREFNGFEAFKIPEIQSGHFGAIICDDNKSIASKRDSFSFSKIWLRARKDKVTSVATVESSRRAFSFRFPTQWNSVAADESNGRNSGGGGRSTSEIDMRRWENGGSELLDFDEENQSCKSLDSKDNAPSFGRRTLLWLMGRQDNDVNSSFTSNV